MLQMIGLFAKVLIFTSAILAQGGEHFVFWLSSIEIRPVLPNPLYQCQMQPMPPPVSAAIMRKRRHRELTEKQFHRMLSVGKWHNDADFAKMEGDEAAWFGPHDQLVLVEKLNTKTYYAFWINWAAAYREGAEKTPPGPYAVFVTYKIRTDLFLRMLGPNAKSVVTENWWARIVSDKYPPENGCAEFANAVVKIGSKIIELRPALHWEIESKQGIVVSVALRSGKAELQLDAYLWDALIEHDGMKYLKEKDGVIGYARIYASMVKSGKPSMK